ncbi:MAG: YfiR family protein [Bryobacteraceae bacterium]|nr:YfiR family protein [Bryobacteraceae bacterium]
MALLSGSEPGSWKVAGFLAALFCAAAGLPQPPAAPAERAEEYRLKAAFLRSFAKFVEWPDSAGEGARRKLLIGILGENPFGDGVQELLEAETPGGVMVETLAGRTLDRLQHCHVLFISASERSRLQQHLDALAQRPVLTVSDVEGFARRGGMIELLLDRNRIRFAINPAAVERAGLRMSSKLLSLAVIVGGAETREGGP